MRKPRYWQNHGIDKGGGKRSMLSRQESMSALPYRAIREAMRPLEPWQRNGPPRDHNAMDDDELRAIAALYCQHGNPKARCKVC